MLWDAYHVGREIRCQDTQLTILRRAQLYVEADARMDSYEDKDGNQRTALNLLQRKRYNNQEVDHSDLTQHRQLRDPFLQAPRQLRGRQRVDSSLQFQLDKRYVDDDQSLYNTQDCMELAQA
jgi:hypothetical protein